MTRTPGGNATRGVTVAVRTARGRSGASQRWLARQLNDPYVRAAKEQGWRSRAAYKLLELDAKFHLIRKGAHVVDLGAAPGGWSQVAINRGAAKVVAIDLLPMEKLAGVTVLQADFTAEATEARLIEALGGKADLVLSDMAPNTTGHAATDHLRIMALAEAALDFALGVLPDGGVPARRATVSAPAARSTSASSGPTPATRSDVGPVGDAPRHGLRPVPIRAVACSSGQIEPVMPGSPHR